MTSASADRGASPLEVVNRLVATAPRFHGVDRELDSADSLRTSTGSCDWRLGEPVLRFLATTVHPEMTTLETGCGYSSVVFAACGSRHTVISPIGQEHQRVQDWCRDEDIDTSEMQFVANASEAILPSMEGPLDLVLVDGDHAFPLPILDWYFTARRLRVGGLLILDDVQLRAVALLCDFLDQEAGRWRHENTIDVAAVFTKLSEDAGAWIPWKFQPWGAEPIARGYIPRLRQVFRIRSRVRGLFGVGRGGAAKS